MPDELFSIAYIALLTAGFRACPNGRDCCGDHSNPRWYPIPEAHLHLVENCVPHPDTHSPRIELFKKSEVLWRIPTLRMEPSGSGNSSIILASDSSLPSEREGFWGCGRINEKDCPIKIPTASCYIEAIIRLYFRDESNDYLNNGYHWCSMLLYIVEYVKGTVRIDDLDIPFRLFLEMQLTPRLIQMPFWRRFENYLKSEES